MLREGESAEARVTASGSAVGTPAYVAPEYLLNDVLDGRSDIYSLGIIAYELLLGRYPFEYDEILELLEIKIYEDPLPLHELNPSINEELSNVIMRAIDRDPAERYQRIEEFLVALRLATQKVSYMSARGRNREALSQVAPESMFDVDRDIFDEESNYFPTMRLRRALDAHSPVKDLRDFVVNVCTFLPRFVLALSSSKVFLVLGILIIQLLLASWYFDDFGFFSTGGGAGTAPVQSLGVFSEASK